MGKHHNVVRHEVYINFFKYTPLNPLTYDFSENGAYIHLKLHHPRPVLLVLTFHPLPFVFVSSYLSGPIPFYLLAACLICYTRVSNRLSDYLLMRHLPGLHELPDSEVDT